MRLLLSITGLLAVTGDETAPVYHHPEALLYDGQPIMRRYPVPLPVIYRADKPPSWGPEHWSPRNGNPQFRGYEMPERWNRVNNGLFNYCYEQSDCTQWRYMGYGHFYYFGNATTAPANITITVANMTEPVVAIPCDDQLEPDGVAQQLRGILNIFCKRRNTCPQWWYHGCGLFAVKTRLRFTSLPFQITQLQAKLPRIPPAYVVPPNRLSLYAMAPYIFPNKDFVKPPLPPMEPLTMNQLRFHPTYDFSMEFFKHVYVLKNGTGPGTGQEALFVIDHSKDSSDPGKQVAIINQEWEEP